MVTGRQLAGHMRISLTTDALAMVITPGHVQPGAMFHSDRLCPGNTALVSSPRFCQAHGIRTSTGWTGQYWDNALRGPTDRLARPRIGLGDARPAET